MNEKKRKQKQYYVNQAKRAKFEKRKLHPGLRGFLCTTNNRERECVREAYNLLNEYANQMYGAEHDMQESSAGGGAAQDVEESLQAELAALKEEKVSKERRFQQVESGAKNCIFISTQLERTAPLAERITREIRESGTQRTRYLLRLLPVQVTCKATEDDIRASAESMIKEAFTEIGVSYTTVFRSRNQAQLTQTDAQTAINNLIDAVCPTARLDHKTPKLTVIMEVIRNVICLSVVRDYFLMKKYNLVELAKGDAVSSEGGGAGGEGSGGGDEDGENGDEEGGGRKDGKGDGGTISECDPAAVAKTEEDDAAGAAKDSVGDAELEVSAASDAVGDDGGSARETAAGDTAAAPESKAEPSPPVQDPEKTPAADQTDVAASSDVMEASSATAAAESTTDTKVEEGTEETNSDAN